MRPVAAESITLGRAAPAPAACEKMSRKEKAVVTIVGILRLSEKDGLQYSSQDDKWREALTTAPEFFGLERFPERPTLKPIPTPPEPNWWRKFRLWAAGGIGYGAQVALERKRAAEEAAQKEYESALEEWRRAAEAHKKALRSSPAYRRAALEFVERQRREPQRLTFWLWQHREYREHDTGLRWTRSLRQRSGDSKVGNPAWFRLPLCQ